MKLLSRFRTFFKPAPVHAALAQQIAQMPNAANAPDSALISSQQLQQLLAEVLRAEGIEHQLHDETITLSDGLMLRAHFFEHNIISPQQVRSATGIAVVDAQHFPAGLREFQHATGADLHASLRSGFHNWAQMDLPALQDSLRSKPLVCTVMEAKLPPHAAQFEHRMRHIVLGPVAHLVADKTRQIKEEHPFCPCCLIGQSDAAFEALIRSDQFIGIRFFVSRDAQGVISADCRVNGEDFAAALDSLHAYAKTWPQRGLEFRKQYVIIKNASHSLDAG